MSDGICIIENPYSAEAIAGWNARLDSLFSASATESRVEINGPQLHRLGILKEFFSPEMRLFLRGIMPDATIWDFHAYEIAARQATPHVAGDQLHGWHPDIHPLPGMDMTVPHFISVFVYLTDVGPTDGPFEFLPLSSQQPIRSGLRSIKVLGRRGTTFVWNKSFYHRASPNLGPVRRRLLKASFHRNYFESGALASDWVAELRDLLGDSDEFLAYLLGKYHRETHLGAHLLPDVSGRQLGTYHLTANSRIERFSPRDAVKLRLRRFLGSSA